MAVSGGRGTPTEGKMTLTYAAEILKEILLATERIEMEKSNFTARGVEAVVIDKFDAQKYCIRIEPIKEGESNGTH